MRQVRMQLSMQLPRLPVSVLHVGARKEGPLGAGLASHDFPRRRGGAITARCAFLREPPKKKPLQAVEPRGPRTVLHCAADSGIDRRKP